MMPYVDYLADALADHPDAVDATCRLAEVYWPIVHCAFCHTLLDSGFETKLVRGEYLPFCGSCITLSYYGKGGRA